MERCIGTMLQPASVTFPAVSTHANPSLSSCPLKSQCPGYRTCTACPAGATGLTPTENGGSGATAVAASKCELW